MWTNLMFLLGLSPWLTLNLSSPSAFQQAIILLAAEIRYLWDRIGYMTEAKRLSVQNDYEHHSLIDRVDFL